MKMVHTAMASFTITDSIARGGGRFSMCIRCHHGDVAAIDEYPDFFFRSRYNRKSGENVSLAPGDYFVTFTRGPEYVPQTKKITVPKKDSVSFSFKLKRWIDHREVWLVQCRPSCACCRNAVIMIVLKKVFFHATCSGRHWVKISTCRRINLGTQLVISETIFYRKDDSMSTKENIIRYDVEVSGFPSSHSGHIVLLRIKEDDYPGTSTIEQWPTWTLPILKWAKEQGGVVGYAHSGWGLDPVEPTRNCQITFYRKWMASARMNL
jgi:hypothetical protein